MSQENEAGEKELQADEMKQGEQQPGTRGKTCPLEERKGVWGGMVR